MKMIKAESRELLNRAKALYLTAFPKSERKPFELMVKKQEEGWMDLMYLEEDGEFAGLAFTVKERDLVLLDYFAIDDSRRGSGCGSAALKVLNDYYKGSRMVLEIECMDDKAKNYRERIRRKQFYQRNGMTELGYRILLFGVEMEILSNKTRVDYKEYEDLYVHAFGERILDHLKRIG